MAPPDKEEEDDDEVPVAGTGAEELKPRGGVPLPVVVPVPVVVTLPAQLDHAELAV